MLEKRPGTVKEYDIVIVGGGPAGLAAGIYAGRARRKTVLLEKGVTGGQIALTNLVENYPGFPDGVSGFDLAQAMQQQARKYGMEADYVEVTSLERADQRFLLKTTQDDYLAKAVILTGGASYRRLGVPSEERLTGRGVSYCATCDGALFRDQTVAVVGGGDAAIDEALFLTRYVSRVNVIHWRDQLRAGSILQERAFAQPKISFLWNTVVTEIVGDDVVTGLRLRNVVTGDETEMAVAAVFIFVGTQPSCGYLRGLVKMDDTGHIIVNEWMETDVPGLFAAGDVRANASRQVVSAAGDGATAAIRADEYISEHFGDQFRGSQ